MTYKHEVIFCIVNAGFSEAVMECARQAGARGGTVMHASGTANASAEKLFGITVQPEKDVVMILVEKSVRDALLKALYSFVGVKTAAQGIAFALPVDGVAGFAPKPQQSENKASDAKTEPRSEQQAAEQKEEQKEE